MKFDRFLSLGASCEVAFQIRRYTQNNSLHFFDWLHAPGEGTMATLETGFEHVFKLENLVVIPGPAVRDLQNNFGYMHHFKRDEQNQITIESVAQQYDKQRIIIDRLIRDWKEITENENVLYVWRWNPNQGHIERMLRALRAARPDQPGVSVLVVNSDERPKLDSPDVFQVMIPFPPSGPNAWMGLNDPWTEAFAACEAWAESRQF
jgi:hypothetical protein